MATVNSMLSKFGLKVLKINAGFMQMEFESNDATRMAAWELYVELLTRVATQPLKGNEGEEVAALGSVHQIFPITREILRKHGPECVRLAYIAVPFLNQVLRPFTSKWHAESVVGKFKEKSVKDDFRLDLERLQKLVVGYTSLMGDIAGIEEEYLEGAKNAGR